MHSLEKKIISIILTIVISVSSCAVTAVAVDGDIITQVSSVESATDALLNSKHVDELEKDEVYPTILIHGIGQAKTFMLDGEGNDAVDPDGKKITGWPLYFYVPELVIKLIVPIILSLITQKDCGLSKTAYLRRLILGAEIKARPTQEIKDLRTEIHHIGNNINQIARSVNAGIARPEDAKQGLYLLRQVYELLYRVVEG